MRALTKIIGTNPRQLIRLSFLKKAVNQHAILTICLKTSMKHYQFRFPVHKFELI